MNKFQAGDKVMFRNKPLDHARAEELGLDPLQPQTVANEHGSACVQLVGAPDYSIVSIERLESLEEWAKHQAPAPQAAPAPKAVSPFVLSRQKALDAYADSRKRLGAWHGDVSPRGQGFTSGYEAGYKDGILAAKAQAFTGQFSAATMARSSDPQTSKDAAQAVARKAGKIADVVLQTLADGTFTGKELAARTGIPLNSVTPRFAQLRRAGLIHAVSGKGGETVWALGNGVAA